MKRIKKFKKLAKKAIKIRDNKYIPGAQKYNLMFFDGLRDEIEKTGIRIKWHDPDSTYEEDVRAYVNAVEELLGAIEYLESLDCEITIKLYKR